MLVTPPIRRFLRYAVVGASTLTFDLVLLYAVTEFAGVPYYIATPLAFALAASVNYLISRKHVFHGTERAIHHGYLYFILLAILGATLTTLGVAFMVHYLGLYYMLARVLVAGVVGMGNYLLNLHFNFKVAGHHP